MLDVYDTPSSEFNIPLAALETNPFTVRAGASRRFVTFFSRCATLSENSGSCTRSVRCYAVVPVRFPGTVDAFFFFLPAPWRFLVGLSRHFPSFLPLCAVRRRGSSALDT